MVAKTFLNDIKLPTYTLLIWLYDVICIYTHIVFTFQNIHVDFFGKNLYIPAIVLRVWKERISKTSCLELRKKKHVCGVFKQPSQQQNGVTPAVMTNVQLDDFCPPVR